MLYLPTTKWPRHFASSLFVHQSSKVMEVKLKVKDKLLNIYLLVKYSGGFLRILAIMVRLSLWWNECVEVLDKLYIHIASNHSAVMGTWCPYWRFNRQLLAVCSIHLDREKGKSPLNMLSLTPNIILYLAFQFVSCKNTMLRPTPAICCTRLYSLM